MSARPRRRAPGSWGGPVIGLATVTAIVALLAGGEVVLGWLEPAFLRDTPVDAPHVYSETLGWALRPRWRGRTADGKPVTVNASGRRGREPDARPRAGATRVVLLGDSVAFGTDVADDETFAERLDAARGFHVVNLAVSGYGTDQSLLRLEREGFGFGPDVVVLNFCMANDYVDNVLETYLYDGRMPKPRYVLEGGALRLRDTHVKKPWLEHLGLRLRERSRLFNALVLLAGPGARAESPSGLAAPEHWESRKNRVLLDHQPAVELTIRLVSEMAARCHERGVRFLVLLHPDRDSFLGDETLVAPFQQDRPEILGVRVVDVRQHYWAARLAYEDVALDRVGHLNPQGHAFVADVLRFELGAAAAAHRAGPGTGVPRL